MAMPRNTEPASRAATSHGVRVRGRAWIEWDGEAFIGPGRAALLEGVAQHGSLTKAAQDVGVTYRTAWKWIRIMNRAAKSPLVQTTVGGAEGGGTHLTPTGRAVLRAHRMLAEGLDAFLSSINERLETVLAAPSADAKPRAPRPGRRASPRK